MVTIAQITIAFIGAVCVIISLAMFGHALSTYNKSEQDHYNPYWHSSTGFYTATSGVWMLCFLGSLMILRSL